jgi:ABC-type nitrate/sulfonate/bicarbonate transport system substrate-binding protein
MCIMSPHTQNRAGHVIFIGYTEYPESSKELFFTALEYQEENFHARLRNRDRGFVRPLINRLAAAALLWLALVNGAMAASSVATPVRIEVPGASNLQFFNLWVALGARYFQCEGLEPKILVAPTPRATGDLLFSGQADVALLPPPMFLGMMAESRPIRLFASLLANEPINLIVRKDIAEARRISLAASLPERLHSMKGLRVGLASEVTPRLRALADGAGINADRDFGLVIVPGPDQLEAFSDGSIDALFAHTPYLETALAEHGAVLVAEASGGEVRELANGQIHALVTTRAIASRDPELVEAVTRAIYRAQRLIHSDPKATVNALLASGVARERRLTEILVAVYGAAVPQTPTISLDGIERDAILYPSHPRAPDFSRVRASDFVAPEFAEQAVAPTR